MAAGVLPVIPAAPTVPTVPIAALEPAVGLASEPAIGLVLGALIVPTGGTIGACVLPQPINAAAIAVQVSQAKRGGIMDAVYRIRLALTRRALASAANAAQAAAHMQLRSPSTAFGECDGRVID
jgi:hypothetical protein